MAAPVPAIEEPAVRRSLRGYRFRALLTLAFGLLALAGALIGIVIVESRAAQLELTGERFQGRVVSVGSDSLVVAFTYHGTERTAGIQLNDSSPTYTLNQPVTVIVDYADPEHLTIRGETNQSQGTVLPMIWAFVAGLFAVLMGVWMLFRARRQAHVLRSGPWRRVRMRYYAELRKRPFFLIETGTRGGSILLLATMTRWRLARAHLPEASSVDLVESPDHPGYVVMRSASHPDILISARVPRGGESRFRKRLERAQDRLARAD